MSKTISFQRIQFNVSTQNKCKYTVCQKTFLLQAIQLIQTVQIQAIQFYNKYAVSSIWPIDRTLSGATTPGQSEPRSDGNLGVLSIPQSSCITGTSPSDALLS